MGVALSGLACFSEHKKCQRPREFRERRKTSASRNYRVNVVC
jgi:hypothetical protein